MIGAARLFAGKGVAGDPATLGRPDLLLPSELKQALRQPGCPLCRLLRQADLHYLRVFLREGKAHAEVYDRIRQAGGFCEGHTRILQELAARRLGDRRSVARLYGWLLDDLASDPVPRSPCPACEAAAEYERASLLALRDILDPAAGEGDLRERFAAGPGLCRDHFVRAASVIEDGESLRALADVQARAWNALSKDLKEYLRKHDYRFSQEPMTPGEEQSWVRAVAAISGVPFDGDGL